MSNHYKIGQRVKWNWGPNNAYGKIKERFTESVTRKIKGTEVTRHATKDEPAYLNRAGRRRPRFEIAQRTREGMTDAL